MTLFARFKKLTLWNKIGVIGGIASIVSAIGFLITANRNIPIESAPIVNVSASRSSVAAGGNVEISNLALKREFQDELKAAVMAADRQWKFLDPKIDSFVLTYNNTSRGLSFETAYSISATITSGITVIENDVASFLRSIESIHKYSVDSESKSVELLDSALGIASVLSSSRSLWNSIPNLSSQYDSAAIIPDHPTPSFSWDGQRMQLNGITNRRNTLHQHANSEIDKLTDLKHEVGVQLSRLYHNVVELKQDEE